MHCRLPSCNSTRPGKFKFKEAKKNYEEGGLEINLEKRSI